MTRWGVVLLPGLVFSFRKLKLCVWWRVKCLKSADLEGHGKQNTQNCEKHDRERASPAHAEATSEETKHPRDVHRGLGCMLA